jgi:replicative DNA helicase
MLLLNKNSNVKKTKALYRDIRDMIKSWSEKETVDIPLSFKTKADLLVKLCDMLSSDKSLNTAIDSLMVGQKYQSHMAFLDLMINQDTKGNEFQDIVNQIRLRKKVSSIFTNYDDLSNIVEDIKEGSFDSIDDLASDYEVIVKTLYTNMMESNRAITLESAASLDLMNDNYEHVIEMIKKKYEKANTTPTGFPIFDHDIMYGGYEPSRLYIFGGGSGAGKSTMLNNTIIESARTMPDVMSNKHNRKAGEINRVYIYITLENTIEEALMRTYQPLFRKTTRQMLADISQGVDIKNMIVSELRKTGSTIIMKYFPAMSISVLDLMGVVDDAISMYGKESIAGLYVDYLDLLKADTKYDMYRLELGHITLSLKTMAVEYNMPVVTASQLSRGTYRIKEAAELGVDMMSESIKKVEHADFVMLLARDQTDDNKIYGKVGKNRSGKSNVSLEFPVDFSTFSFSNGKVAANKEKPDSCSSGVPFGGLSSV